MKSTLNFLFLLFANFVHPQNITIINLTTKEPVPYVTAFFYEGEAQKGGDYANERGELTIPSTCNKVVLSCLGFKTKTITSKFNLSQVFLEEAPFELNEVVITDTTNTAIIGHINKKRIAKYGTNRFSQTAVYIDNPYKEKVYVKSFLFRPYKIKSKRMYRIHLYKKSNKGDLPGEDLLPKDIVRYVDKGDKGVVEIDLSEYGILMPENGIYAAIEGLGAYDKNGHIITSQYYSGIGFEAFQTYEYINFYQPLYAMGKGWIEENKWLERENRSRGVKNPDKKYFKAASFGLKVFTP